MQVRIHDFPSLNCLLNRLANCIRPGIVKNINTQAFPLYLQIENIINFIKACMELKVRNQVRLLVNLFSGKLIHFLFRMTQDLFEPVDLYEDKNAARVVSCLDALGRVVSKIPDYKGPVLQLSPTKIPVGSSLELPKDAGIASTNSTLNNNNKEIEEKKASGGLSEMLRWRKWEASNNNTITTPTNNNGNNSNSTINDGDDKEKEKDKDVSWAKKVMSTSKNALMDVWEGRKRSNTASGPVEVPQSPSALAQRKKKAVSEYKASPTPILEESGWEGEEDWTNLNEEDGWIFPDSKL